MAIQIKTKRTRDKGEKIIYVSRGEAVMLIKNLITLLTDPVGGGVTNMLVYPEDLKEIPYRLYLIPQRDSVVKEKRISNNWSLSAKGSIKPLL